MPRRSFAAPTRLPAVRTLRLALAGGVTADVTLIAHEPGDEQHGPPLLRIKTTLRVPSSFGEDVVTVENAVARTCRDGRRNWSSSPESNEAGWEWVSSSDFDVFTRAIL